MREIKFRAWDEETETMYYSDQEYEDCFFGFDKGVIVGWLRQTEPQTRDEPAYDYGKPINVMQFTGLKDKNGKEIYEGDIIDACPSPNHNAYRKYLRTVEWNDELAQYQAPFSDRSGLMLFTKQQCKEYEVIGDIHENPELLEEKSND